MSPPAPVPPAPADPSARARRRRRGRLRSHARRRLRTIGAVAALALLLVAAGVALAALRYLPALETARALRTDVAALARRAEEAGLAADPAALDALGTELAAARARVDELRGLLAGDPLVAIARILPPTASAVRAADELGEAAARLGSVGAGAVGLADRLLAARAAGSSTLAALTELLATEGTRLDALASDVAAAEAALASVSGDAPAELLRLRDEVSGRLAGIVPAVDGLAAARAVLPPLLGWDGRRRYLVLAQDPAELRPTGGYIGSFGILGFDRGRLVERTFSDVFALDLPLDYPWIEPPAELRDLLLGTTQPWQFADANWSPDYPTAARDALRLYENESGDLAIDGVIAIDTRTIDALLAVTGPVAVPGRDVTVASGETLLTALRLTRAPAPGEPLSARKQFLADFADALLPALLGLPVAGWVELAGDAETFRARRLVQVWVRDDELQARLASGGWAGGVDEATAAGGIPGPRADYLYPVDANVAPPSKLHAVTTRLLDLDVRLDATGTATNVLRVTWVNAIEADAGAALRAIPQLADERRLGVLLRLVLPGDARLESITAGDGSPVAPAVLDAVAGRAIVGAYHVAPPGTTLAQYAWTVPYAAAVRLAADGAPFDGEYRLVVRRQPGTLPGPVVLRIAVPDGMRITAASAGLVVEGRVASVALGAVDRDLVLGIRFARATPIAGSPLPPAGPTPIP